jgi:hypothetical protein
MEGKLYSLNGCMGGEFINLRVDNEHMFVRARDIQSLIYDIKDHSVAISVTTLDMGTYHMGCELSDVHALLRAISQLNDSNPPAMCLTMRTNTMTIPELPPQILRALSEVTTEVKKPRFNGKAFAEFLRLRNKVACAGYTEDFLENVEEWDHEDARLYYGEKRGFAASPPGDRFREGLFNDREEFPNVHLIYEALQPRNSGDTVGYKWMNHCVDGTIYTMTPQELVKALNLDGCERVAMAVQNGANIQKFTY